MRGKRSGPTSGPGQQWAFPSRDFGRILIRRDIWATSGMIYGRSTQSVVYSEFARADCIHACPQAHLNYTRGVIEFYQSHTTLMRRKTPCLIIGYGDTGMQTWVWAITGIGEGVLYLQPPSPLSNRPKATRVQQCGLFRRCHSR